MREPPLRFRSNAGSSGLTDSDEDEDEDDGDGQRRRP